MIRSITRPITSPIARAVTDAYGAAWNPRALFALGEQGVIYDPNDLSTLFQDAAGTIPVTAAGQPVGLMLDKRLGLMRGAELVTNGDFSAGPTGWILGAGWGISGGRAQIDGSNAASSLLTFTAGVPSKAGVHYEVSYQYSVTTGRIRFNPVMGNSTALVGAGNTGVFRGVVVATSTSASVGVSIQATDAGTVAWVDNISIRELPGNHAFQPTAASRPMLRQNATTGAYYLATDGSDDWMQTDAIDFTGTDKISLFTGIRKLSDAAAGIVCELSASSGTTAGTFYIAAPTGSTDTYGCRSGGSVPGALAAAAGRPAPNTSVVTGAGNISADSSVLRLNGTQAAMSTADQGTGNFGNYPLYLFRRGGTTLPFNGHFYGLTIVGRLCTAAETRNVERLYANKAGVTLA